MNQNSVSGDIVDLKLRQMGATNISRLRSNMYIVKFQLENGIVVSYVFNITKHDKYFLQRMQPYAMVQGKYADTQEITQFIAEDLRHFRNAEKSHNFEEFLEISRKSLQLAQEVENVFLHYHVDNALLDEMLGHLDHMMGHLAEVRQQYKPVVPKE